MDYGRLFSKAWRLIWEHKFLIVLGILVALGSAGGGGSGRGISGGNGNRAMQELPQFEFDPSTPLQNIGLPAFALGGIIILAIFAVLVGLVLWGVGTLSRGGLIHGADVVSKGKTSSFSDAFQAGWKNGWQLIGISIVPAIPGLILFLTAIYVLAVNGGIELIAQGEEILNAPKAGVFLPVAVLVCILIPLSLLFSLLRTFANRACILEGEGVFAAYRRGFEVLGGNLAETFILFVLQVAVSIGIWLVLAFPAILVTLCCLLWPLLLIVQGIIKAFFSTLWTLAWNYWVGEA